MFLDRDSVKLSGVHSTLSIRRARPSVIVVTITGRDVGEHGDAPFRELMKDLERGPFHLFIDARGTRAASMEVSNLWAQWLRAHRDRFRSLHMLTGSQFIQLTADFVRRWADLGDVMRIYTDPVAFDSALAQTTSSPATHS